jgi:hypothetical protein
MKQRALPQSFWQQPNVANAVPPSSIYSSLPPLFVNGDDVATLTPIEEVTSPNITSLTPGSQTGITWMDCQKLFFPIVIFENHFNGYALRSCFIKLQFRLKLKISL